MIDDFGVRRRPYCAFKPRSIRNQLSHPCGYRGIELRGVLHAVMSAITVRKQDNAALINGAAKSSFARSTLTDATWSVRPGTLISRRRHGPKEAEEIERVGKEVYGVLRRMCKAIQKIRRRIPEGRHLSIRVSTGYSCRRMARNN